MDRTDASDLFLPAQGRLLPSRPRRPARAAPAARRRRCGGQRTRPARAGGECCKAGDTTPPLDLIKATPKAASQSLQRQDRRDRRRGSQEIPVAGCNGCHGVAAAVAACARRSPTTPGSMARRRHLVPPDRPRLRWIEGRGLHRVKREVVVGPMPPFGGIIKTSDDLWKIIAWIRSVNPSSATKPPLQ